MQDTLAVHYAWLIPLLPLIGAGASGFFGKRFLKANSHWPIWLSVGASAILSLSLLFRAIAATHGGAVDVHGTEHWYTWIDVGGFTASAGAFVDPLTCVMLSVVTGIGFLITVFAAGYMKGEEGYYRFFAFLGLFIFSMTCLVLGDNFVMLYLGWEGVGLCSYLLVGYYYERPAARDAAKKAFLVNRVGDFGFGLGIMSIFLVFGSITYFGGHGGATTAGVLQLAADPGFLAALPPWRQELVRWIPFLLMLGAFGKSAQFPLYVWLPDAMEGPTPVSALIHAATMVTAGVYMVTRAAPLFVGNAAAMATIAAVGAFTALFAASIALRQFDLKKVFAYSTVSQLGYMFVGAGILAPTAAVFHLVTHAFFKALLFLSAGVVMHAMSGHLDMRKMSGLKRVLPKTNILIFVGCCALAGVPGFSGFFSKDEIVGRAFHVNTLLWLVVLFTAFLTAYYTFRLYFQVFQGPLIVPEGPAPTDAHAADQAHAPVAGPQSVRIDGGVFMVSHADSAHGHDLAGGSSDLGTSSGAERAEAGASHEAVKTGDVAVSGVDHAARSHGVAGHGSHGDPDHDHEPMLMILPLAVLAIGALLAGYLNWPSESLARFLGHSPSLRLGYEVASARFAGSGGAPVDAALWGQPETGEAGGSNVVAMFIGGIVALSGIALAYLTHLSNRGLADRIAAGLQPLTGLLEAKYWVDQIYELLIVEPLRQIGNIFLFVDRYLIDGVVSLTGLVPQLGGFTLKLSTQRGYVQGYAAAMLLGLAVILAIIFLR